MKQITILLCSFFLLTSFVSPTASLKGVWNTGDQNTKIQTYQKDGKWYGKIISSDNPKAKKNTIILKGFQKKGDVWKGKIYAIKSGKWVDASIKPSSDALNITVYAGFITKKLKWKKVK